MEKIDDIIIDFLIAFQKSDVRGPILEDPEYKKMVQAYFNFYDLVLPHLSENHRQLLHNAESLIFPGTLNENYESTSDKE